MAICPGCEAEIEVDEFDVDKGDQLTCPECGEDLEVTNLSPIELDLVAEEDEEETTFADDDEEDVADEDGGGDDWDE
jgi:alpha-aminoadipate carrier protein LysW